MNKLQNLTKLRLFGTFTNLEWMMLISLMLPTGLDLINAGMLSVALPVIQTEFNISVDLLALVTASGFLPRVTLMPVYGRIGDMIGKKRTFLIGLTLFLFGALICFFSPTFYWLIFGRLLQGVGGGAVPLAVALIVNIVSKEKRNRALSVVNSSGPAVNVIGPIIGGFIIVGLGWRSIFAIIISISVLALVLGARFIPKDTLSGSTDNHFDWIGALALTSTVFFFLFSIMTQSIFPLGSVPNFFFFFIAGISLIILIWNGLKNSNPFVELSIVKNRQFIAPSLATGLRMFALSGASFLLVLFMANVYNLDPKSIGILLIVFRLSLFIGVVYSGVAADRWSSKNVGMVCLFMLVVGLLLISQIVPIPTNVGLFLGMFLVGLGPGLCIVAFTKEAAVSLGDQKVGLATGLFNTIRFSGVALSAPILGLLLVGIFDQHGGSQSIIVAYQTGFLVLAGFAGIGIIASNFIPVSSKDQVQTQDVYHSD